MRWRRSQRFRRWLVLRARSAVWATGTQDTLNAGEGIATMDLTEFVIGGWHPFGPHGGEQPQEIIDRKRREVALNGWTLWSFQFRSVEALTAWEKEMSSPNTGNPLVFCSDSVAARDPAEIGGLVRSIPCWGYRPVGEDAWRSIPAPVSVRHPFRRSKHVASAFVVRRIIHPVEEMDLPTVEWLSQGRWRQDRLPTRGEYLVRRGGGVRLRPVIAILELQAPFVVHVIGGNGETNKVPAG